MLSLCEETPLLTSGRDMRKARICLDSRLVTHGDRSDVARTLSSIIHRPHCVVVEYETIPPLEGSRGE